MKLLHRLPLLPLAFASLFLASALRAGEFNVNDGTSDADQASANRVVLMNQTGQPKLKIFVSAKPNEKPQPQTELKESDYTVNLSDPAMEVALYVSTMDNKKKSPIRKARHGDILAVVFQDGGLAVLKTRSSGK